MFNKISNIVYGENLRQTQSKVIEFLEKNIDKHDDLILDLPTGCGKSLIAYAFAHSKKLSRYNSEGSYAPGAYILTTTKQLTQQYLTDFGKPFSDGLGTMFSCKGAQNYICNCNQHSNCKQVRTLRRLLKKAAPTFLTRCADNCCYDIAKKLLFGKFDHKQQVFVEQPQFMGVTNYKYLLNMFKYTKDVHPKTLLVMDQAHNAQLELMSFIEIDFSRRFTIQTLKFDSMVFDYCKQDFIDFVKRDYRLALDKFLQNLKVRVGRQGHNDLQAAKDYEKYDRHMCKINRFIQRYDQNPGNWVFQKQDNTVYFRPIYVHDYAKECLFDVARKRIYMSATIGDPKTFSKSLGIKDYAFVTTDSPFPRQNRKVYYIPCGKMSRNDIQKSLPKVTQTVDQILSEFPKDKGIIHTNSYKIASRIKSKSKHKKRFLDHTDSKGRQLALLQHQESDEPTVLLSPSMSEGIDLKDDLSRFQIIAKIPYPNLGDQRIKIRCNNDYIWYVNQAVKGIVQAYGRSIRTQKDHADTFILDGCFQDLLHRNAKLFPKWFIDALR